MKQVGICIELVGGGIGIRRGIGRYAHQYGPLRFTQIEDLRHIDFIKSLELDGIIARVWNPHQGPISELGIPIVDVSNSTLKASFSKVLLDNAGAGRLAAEHLLGLGLRHFLAIDNYSHEGFQLRAKSFREQIEQSKSATCTSVRSYRDPSFQSDKREIAYYTKVLQQQPKPFGVYAVNDVLAAWILEAARMADLNVPDDVAVIGTDNAAEVCDLTDPPLTSIELNTERVGYESAKLLVAMMDKKEAPKSMIISAGGVVTRVSTDVLAIDDPDIVAAARYIRLHATDGIDVKSVLDMIPISRRRLERRFREVVGHGLHDEIQRVRISHSKRLLIDTDLSMQQIAMASGFMSQSYFGRAFKLVEGLTPTEYRQKLGHS